MASLNAVLHDPRRRNLAILAVVAVVMVALATAALMHQAALVAPKYTPRSFFPKLAQKSQAVARIHIESKKYGDVDIAFQPVAGWVLPDHHDYPADYDQVKKTLVGMGALQTIQPETARQSWLHYLHLGAPEDGGDGTKIVLLNDKDQIIAQMIAGKRRDIGDASGAFGLFARKPDSAQSWLLRSVFVPSANPKSWMNKRVVGIDRARIREVDVSPLHGAPYVVRRDKPSDADFKLVHMPRGRTLSYPSAPDGVAAALVDFTFDNVSPARNFDFAHSAGLVTKTFDGLSVSARIVKKNGIYWVTLSATALKPTAKAEARKINKAADGWAFQVPAYKGSQFTSPLESLLKPRGRK
jgi:hypothetical protein